MKEYLIVSVVRVRLKEDEWTKKYEYVSFNDIMEMYAKTDGNSYCNMIVQKNLFGVHEIVSKYKLFILENTDDVALKNSLKQLEDILNDDNEVFFVYRSSLDQKRYPTLNGVDLYLESFSDSAFARAINYRSCKNKTNDEQSKPNKRLIRKKINDYRKNNN